MVDADELACILQPGPGLAFVLQQRQIDLAVAHVDAKRRGAFGFPRAFEPECLLIEIGGRVDVLHREGDVADTCWHGMSPTWKPRHYATFIAQWESRQNAASCGRVFGGGMRVGAREIAVAAAGFCAFLNLYSPQALLPALSREFGVGPAELSAIMTASTLAIALTA